MSDQSNAQLGGSTAGQSKAGTSILKIGFVLDADRDPNNLPGFWSGF